MYKLEINKHSRKLKDIGIEMLTHHVQTAETKMEKLLSRRLRLIKILFLH